MMELDKDGFVCTNATGLEYNIEYYLLIGSLLGQIMEGTWTKHKENNLVPILQQVLVGQLSQPISWSLHNHLNIVNTLFIRFLNKNESISIDSI